MPLAEPVWTPLGQRPIGELQEGEEVLCPDGQHSKIIGVFPQGKRPIYQFRLADDSIARCDDNHLWPIRVAGASQYRVLSMKQIMTLYGSGVVLFLPTISALAGFHAMDDWEQRGYQGQSLWMRIECIQEQPPEETVCIKIDHPLGLFITRDFVVTHNTDALLMDFAQHVGRGYKSDWRGIIFRQTFPELEDVVNKSKKWFPQIWPQATFNAAKMSWNFPDGEALLFRHFRVADDYWSYHGHAYPWIAWEELTTYPDDKCYKVMMACSRSTRKDMPRKYRATTNPYGVGHNWVKRRFHLPLAPGEIVGPRIVEKSDDGSDLPSRRAVHGHLYENKILLFADPLYVSRIKAAARNPAELAAWIDGSWDVTSGGMFDDCWDAKIHIVPDVTSAMIPRRWKIIRSYDHGQSKPFSCGWTAESNGEPLRLFPGKPYARLLGPVPGDLIRLYEWYGCGKQPNEGLRLTASEIAKGILSREREYGILGRVRTGIADSAIFDDYEPGRSVAGDMQRQGVFFYPADKGRGSRSQGWQQLREYLKGAFPVQGGIREKPGLFITARCHEFMRTFPVLPRDDDDLDDVDTDAEDHIGDEVRYLLRRKNFEMRSGNYK